MALFFYGAGTAQISGAVGELGYLPIRNYTPVEYNAMPQNWAIVQDKRGLMYFGNNEGILEYDGVKWRKIPLPDDPNIRSLSIDSNGVIYVGAQGDFGFLSPDSMGTLKYTSLLPYIEEADRDFADVWTNFVTKDGIFFQANHKIFRWNGDTVMVWRAKMDDESKFHFMFYVHNTLYVRQKGVGLMKFLGDQLVLIQGGELFADQDIYFMTAYDSEKILLNTRTHGLYMLKPTDPDYYPKDRTSPAQINEITPFRTQIDKFFIENFIYNGLKLPDGNFSIGTQGGGVIIIDRKGQLIRVLNKNTGIQDGSIYAQYLDDRNNLWLALGNGISKLEVNAPITSFDGKTGLEGTVQSIVRHNNTLYVATLLGVYFLPPAKVLSVDAKLSDADMAHYEHSGFLQIKGITTQCWDLLSVNEEHHSTLLVASNEGIYAIDKDNKVTFVTKYDPWLMYHSKLDPSRVYIGCVDGISSLYFKNGKWLDIGRIDGIEESIISISEDKDENLWLSPLPEGLIKLNIVSTLSDGKINETEVERYDTTDGLPTGLVFLQHGMNRTLFASEYGLYKFENGAFKTDDVFGLDFANGEKRIHRASEDKSGKVWMETISPQDKFEMGYAEMNGEGKFDWISVPFRGMPDEILHAIHHDDNRMVTWLGGPGGISRYDGRIVKDYHKDFAAMIRKVVLGEDSTIFMGANYDQHGWLSFDQPAQLVPVLDYEYNSLTFEYAAPSFDDESVVRFKHYLEGFGKNWTDWREESKTVYTNLPEGEYKFRVKAINAFDHESREAVYSFTIKPPWHRTIWAYITYVLSFIAFVYAAITVSTRGLQKIIKQKTAEVVRQKEEIELKNKDITDSINYAQKIQAAILPNEEDIREHLPESFVLFKPKDIVSGDFYWFSERDGTALITAADCTGHGVPGAFMSMIGNSLLNEIVNEQGITEPAKILQQLKLSVIKSLKQTGEAGTQKDGMDIALCAFDMANMKLEFAGAYNPLLRIRNNEVEETRSDRMPIGVYSDDGGRVFTNFPMEMEKGDVYYIFSDGFVDQFGGPKGKKFMGKKFKQLLLDIHNLPMDKQRRTLDEAIEEWKAHDMGDGNPYEQMDDILVIGVKV